MSSSLNPSVVLDALKILTTPANSGAHGDGESPWFRNTDVKTEEEDCTVFEFDRLLAGTLKSFNDSLKSDVKFVPLLTSLSEIRSMSTKNDPRWMFTDSCVKLIKVLSSCLLEVGKRRQNVNPTQTKDIKPGPDVLSVNQQKTVLTAIQFIVCLGIGPALQPGVGIPMELRSELGKVVAITGKISVSPQEKEFRLLFCVQALLECVKVPSLGALVLSRHLTDALAVLLQICHGQQDISKSQERKSHRKQTDEDHKKEPSGCVVDNVDRINMKSTNHHSNDQAVSESNAREYVHSVKTSLSALGLKATDNSCLETKNASDNDVSKRLNTESNVDGSDACLQGNEILNEIKTEVNDYSVSLADREWCATSLNSLVDRVYQPILVRELLFLQGGPSPQMLKKIQQQSTNRSVNPEYKPPLLARAPPWLRKGCGQLLTQVLLKPNGVHHVLRGMLDIPSGSSPSNYLDWRKCEAVAKVIANVPKQMSTVEEYYKHISPQVLELLHTEDRQVTRQFCRVGCSVINIMSAQHPELTDKHLMTPLTEPLRKCLTQPDDVLAEGQVVVTETLLTQCVEDLHKARFDFILLVLVSGVEPSARLFTGAKSLLLPLFKLYCFLKQGVSYLRSAVKEIMVKMLTSQDKTAGVTSLELLLFHNCGYDTDDEDCQTGLTFAPGGSGGVVLVWSEKQKPRSEKVKVECIGDVLRGVEKDGLAGEFFLALLQKLTQIIRDESSSSNAQPDDIHELNKLPSERRKSSQFQKEVLILNLLAEMCETLGPSCLKSSKHVLEFVKGTLERGVEVCSKTSDAQTSLFESETVTMALGLLTAVLSGALEVTDEDKKQMAELCPLLHKVEEFFPDHTVQEMASDVRIAIATHGAVWSTKLSKTAKKPLASKNSPKIEIVSGTESDIVRESLSKNNQSVSLADKGASSEISKQSAPLLDDNSDSTSKNQSVASLQAAKDSQKGVIKKDNPVDQNSALSQALEEVRDPLVPVRGHGLIALKTLIENKDPAALKQQDSIFTIFQQNLSHSDSYLYLASVNGMVAMAKLKPDTVIQSLTQQFANFSQLETPRPVELRLKLGECIVRTCRYLGDMLPKYRDVLLAAILNCAKDDVAEIRASSLSNLGEICRLLRFSLGSVSHEVFQCCSSLLKSDSDDDVRKAAAMVLTMLLQGLGKDALVVMKDVLRDLYRVLKLQNSVEKNDGVLVHINLALGELDTVMREYLFPGQTLTKKILVSRPQ